jgi:hypothetical protein
VSPGWHNYSQTPTITTHPIQNKLYMMDETHCKIQNSVKPPTKRKLSNWEENGTINISPGYSNRS